LASTEYYAVPQNQIAETLGDTAFYVNLSGIVLAPVFGILIDAIGRKIPIVIGLIMVGTSFLLMPFFTSVYPSFFSLRMLLEIGAIPLLVAPLAADYIEEKSLGLAGSYVFHLTLSPNF
jgi:MFS family permease